MMSEAVRPAFAPPEPGPPAFVARPPASLDGWVRCFEVADLPVLRRTAVIIEELHARSDDVDAHTLAEAIGDDPLMTLKVMARVATLRRRVEGSEPETLVAALVMMGITPFFAQFTGQPTVETVLESQPAALEGLYDVLSRSHRAARFALAFAVHRLDHDATAIQVAALLHDFAELLMWIRAPQLALEVRRRQRADTSLRSADAQREVMKVAISDLQHELMVRWNLPKAIVDLADDLRDKTSLQSKTVVLAIRLARHTEVSWDNPAVAADIDAIASLLNLGVDPARLLLRSIDSP